MFPTAEKWLEIISRNAVLAIAIGVALIVIGLIGLIPASAFGGRSRTITFSGPHGKTRIQLKAVESTINKAAAKYREIKKITATVLPAEDGRGVRIPADVTIYKPAGTNARNITMLVSDYIAQEAKRLLGDEEPVSIDLNVTRIVVDEDSKAPAEAPSILDEKGLESAPEAETAPVAAPEAEVGAEPEQQPEPEIVTAPPLEDEPKPHLGDEGAPPEAEERPEPEVAAAPSFEEEPQEPETQHEAAQADFELTEAEPLPVEEATVLPPEEVHRGEDQPLLVEDWRPYATTKESISPDETEESEQEDDQVVDTDPELMLGATPDEEPKPSGEETTQETKDQPDEDQDEIPR